MANENITVGIVCVVVVIIAVILTLLTPWYTKLDPDDYGTYVQNNGTCLHDMRTVEYVCHPHPDTNRGCDLSTIPGNQTGISYSTVRFEHQPCKVNRIESQWSTPTFSECIGGVQTVTRMCEYVSDVSGGVNNCFDTTGDNGVIYYAPYDYLTTTQLCAEPPGDTRGEWILLDPTQAQNLPRNTLIPSSLSFRTLNDPIPNLFTVSSLCSTEGGVLTEGELRLTLACRLGDTMIIPSNPEDISMTSCVGVVPENKQVIPCRYLPNGYRYYHFFLPDGRVVQETPLVGIQRRTIGYQITRADLGLSVGHGIPVQFVFVHLEEGMAKIAAVMGGGRLGFLGVNSDRQLVWQQGKTGPNSPGISLDEAHVFSIDIFPSSDGVRIRFADRLFVIDEGESVRVRDFVGKSFAVN